MSLNIQEKGSFQHILRLLSTNVDGNIKIMYALTTIRGVGPRFANLVCKKADVDMSKRAGELSVEELERLITIIQDPAQYKIPAWFMNRQRDPVDGKNAHLLVNQLDTKLREDIEKMKRMRLHRGLRHFWGYRVRGQHTNATGRRGVATGIIRKN